jgi:hypothetical protein
MQLPSIDRIQNLRPLAVESASLATGKVVPVAPVNPGVQSTPAVEPTPSVVNMINTADKPNVGEGVYTSVSDPTRKGADAAGPPKDWTVKRPAPEKVEDPPPEPISKILMDHLKSLWQASAAAVQVQQQVRSQSETTANNVNGPQGVNVEQVLTYSPTKINKTEKPQM